MATMLTPLTSARHLNDQAGPRQRPRSSWPRRLPTARADAQRPQGRYVRDKEVAEAAAGQLTRRGSRRREDVRVRETTSQCSPTSTRAGPCGLIGWGRPTIDARRRCTPAVRTAAPRYVLEPRPRRPLVDAAQKEMGREKRLALYHQFNSCGSRTAAARAPLPAADLTGASKRSAEGAATSASRPRNDDQVRRVPSSRVAE